MEENKNVPEIRFGGFDGKWEETFMGDLYNFQYGFFNNNPSNGGRYPIYGANGVIGGYTDYNSEDAVVIGHMGEYAGVVLWANGKHFVTYNGIITKPASESLDAKFGYFLLKKENIRKICGGSGQPFLSYDMLNKIATFYPSRISEQIKISDFFQNLDNSIKNHNTQLKKLTNLKKAMLFKMFPQDGATVPEIRFNGFVKEWNESSLDEEILFFTGLTYSPSDVNSKANTLVLRSSNVKNDEIIDADNVYVDESVINCTYVKQGDIIVVVRNGSRRLIGKHAQVKKDMPNTVIGAFMTGVRAEVPSFLNALLSTQLFQKQIEENLGATINQITTGVFKKMMFKFPKTNEQEQIGSYFQNLDTLIFNHKEQLKKLNQIKKACLSKLFVSQE